MEGPGHRPAAGGPISDPTVRIGPIDINVQVRLAKPILQEIFASVSGRIKEPDPPLLVCL